MNLQCYYHLQESSFIALQNCVAGIDIQKFEILLCVGNKADLVPGHYAHAEYRRFLQRHGESSSDPHSEFLNYGIDETEGCSLLGGEDPVLEIRKSSLEWCCQNNVEFIESCASNAAFDKCKFPFFLLVRYFTMSIIHTCSYLIVC